jgi:hypothetical protein
MHCKKPRFVDECTKTLQQISTIFKDLKLFELYTTNSPAIIHNINADYVQWAHCWLLKKL